ncbi:glycosyltransferase [Bradyrhizobium elkanii]
MSVSAMAEGMVERGHRVTVFATNSNLDQQLNVPVNCPVEVDGVTVWYFEQVDFQARYFWWSRYLSQSMGYLYTPALKRVMREMLPSVDIVHTQLPFIYPSMAAGRIAAAGGKPFFYHQRGVFHPERLRYRGLKKKLYIDLIEKPLMRSATGLIALTPEEIDIYHQMGIRTPCYLVPNGIDVRRFRREARPNAFANLGMTDVTKVVLFLGRLHPQKGIDVLLDAFFDLAHAVPEAMLVLAGPDEHNLSSQLATLAESKGLGGRVVFPGMIVGEEKLELLARADVFVLPSTGEGLSMAILEALASGTPVVISPECNFPKVADVGAGIVVDRNPRMISEAIRSYLVNTELARAAGQAAYEFAKNELGWSRIVARLEQVYLVALEQMAGKSGSAAQG